MKFIITAAQSLYIELEAEDEDAAIDEARAIYEDACSHGASHRALVSLMGDRAYGWDAMLDEIDE